MSRITKQDIIDAIKAFHDKNKIAMRAKDMPYSGHTIRKHFKTFYDALIAAGVSISSKTPKPPKEIQCETCDTTFTKYSNQIARSEHHFCSHSCSASYTNTYRTYTEETKIKIKDGIDKYNKTKIALRADINGETPKCIICQKSNLRATSLYCSKKCYKNSIENICCICNTLFHGDRKTCSTKCLNQVQINTGHTSQQVNPRRSSLYSF